MVVKTETITQEVFIPASPELVYEALTNPVKQTDFTGSLAEGGDKIGDFTAWEGYIYGKVIELVKGKKIVWEWKTTEWPKGAGASRVELTLKQGIEKGVKGTLLKMVHSLAPSVQASDYAQGWIDYYWTPLKKYFHKK